MDIAIRTLQRWLETVADHALWYAAAGLAGLLLLALIRRVLSRRRRKAPPEMPDLALDVGSLGEQGPPEGSPFLEFYHLPVRLAAIVLAPVGHLRDTPTDEELPEAIDSIVPGLKEVAARHGPTIRRWPRQVSPRGFAHAFFRNVRLPGDGGKKTPWSSTAGVFRYDDQPMMAGLVLRAEEPNRHGQYIMQYEEQWLDILRVRKDV
jgi:hypothetical protein